MHFVKKEPTTEEQKEQKRKEREKKLKIFSAARDRLFDKRQKGELDEEVLAISGQLLQKNPDVYTFWNIRRQALILISQKIAAENSDDEAKRDERLAALYKEEMILTEACIQENPKSYGAWFQRGWVLERTPKPDYQFELKLCNLALRLDERNFHCWDHRRIVCRFANIPLEDELKFSDEKVNDNFSNYSAWHYRSSLLARTHPDPDGRLPMDEATLAKELGLATNAFYTDPEDQSAWFYTSWLFDDQHAFAEGPVPVWVTVDRKKSTILLVMSGAVEAKTVGDMIATDAEGEWIPADSQAQSSQVWLYKSSSLGPATKVTLSYKALDVQVEDEWTDLDAIRALLAPANPEGSLKTALEKMLASCQELATVEPHNKWPTFIATLCMRRLDAQANHDQILSNLEKKLPELDPKRAGMYADLASDIRVDRFLLDALAEYSPVPDTLRMVRMELTSLGQLHLFAGRLTQLDLSENRLKSVAALRRLPLLEYVTLNSNEISSLECLSDGMDNLEFVSIASNGLTSVQQIADLKKAKKLGRLVVCENPFCDDKEQLEELRRVFGDSVRVIPFWL